MPRRYLLALLAPAALACAPPAPAQTTPDLTTAGMTQLRADYQTQQAEIARQRSDGLKKLLDAQVEQAHEMVGKAKVAGNITAQAAANVAVKLFADAKAAFDKDGKLPVVATNRRDLENMVNLFKLNAQVVEDKQTTALKALQKVFAAKLGELLANQQTPVADDDRRIELLTQLLGRAPAAPAATNAPPAAAGTNAAPGETAAPPTVIGTSGDAANWTPLMRIEIVVRDALEIVSLPVNALTVKRAFHGEGGNGRPWDVVATPERELVTSGAAPAFRAQSLPPFKPVSVLTWPSAANDWTLELRTKALAVPSRHAVLLETDASTCRPLGGATPAAAGVTAAPRPAAAPVWVRFDSAPTGAYVAVNGAVLGTKDTPLLTPFNYQLPAEPADIRIRRRGYQDATIAQARIFSNAYFRVTLQPMPGFVERTVTVPANGPEWVSCGVRATKGLQVRIAASGTWSCGAGGEMVDADGYPNNDKFFNYYLDPAKSPRLVKTANYGQLLARVLPNGDPVAVGKQGGFAAPADGDIALSINEPAAARHDNHGQLSVRVTVQP